MIDSELWELLKARLDANEMNGWPCTLTVCSDQSCNIKYPDQSDPRNHLHFKNFDELRAHLMDTETKGA